MRTARGERVTTIRVPDAAPWDALRRLTEEYTQKQAERAATKRTLDTLHRRHGRATQKDHRSTVDALRKGEPLPPEVAGEDSQQRIEACRRLLAAYETTLADIADDLAAVVSENREEWEQETGERVAGVQAEIVEAVERVGELISGRLWPLRGLGVWLREYPDGKHLKAPTPLYVHLPGAHGRYSVQVVLGALLEAFRPPAEASDAEEAPDGA